MTKKASTWSFSRLKAFEQCPFQFYHMKVLQTYSEPETEAMLYGTAFHDAAEHYVAGDKELPARFDFAKALLDKLIKRKGEKLPEFKMGLTQDLQPCGFFDDDVWFRGIADLTILNGDVAEVLDYKTGRNAKYADKGQLELMALATFAHYPEVNTVKAGLLFVVANAFVTDKYHRDDIPQMWEKWLTKHARMEKAYETDVWNAHPSGLCKKHCAVLDCVHNGRK